MNLKFIIFIKECLWNLKLMDTSRTSGRTGFKLTKTSDGFVSYSLLKSKGYELYKKYAQNEEARKVLLEFEQIIDSLPQEELTRITRCGECRSTTMYGTDDEPCIYCTVWGWEEMPRDGFCHRGEPRLGG